MAASEARDRVCPDDRPAQNPAGRAGGAVYDCRTLHPPPPTIQGWHGQVPFAAGRRKLHRNCSDALQIRQYCLCVYPGRVCHGLPVLRLYPGGPCARPDGGGDCLGNLHRAKRFWGARLPHRFNGHRGAAAQFQQCDGLFGDHLLPGRCQHRHAQYQPVHLRPGAENRRAGKAASAINAVRFAARAG